MELDSFVNIHLVDPVERMWGRLLSLNEAGITLRGIDVRQIESFKYQWHQEEQHVFPQTVFFPLRRVQKIDQDEAMGSLPSIIEAVIQTSGMVESDILAKI